MYSGRNWNYHGNSSGSFSGLRSTVTDVGAPDFRGDFVDLIFFFFLGGGGGIFTPILRIIGMVLYSPSRILNRLRTPPPLPYFEHRAEGRGRPGGGGGGELLIIVRSTCGTSFLIDCKYVQ